MPDMNAPEKKLSNRARARDAIRRIGLSATEHAVLVVLGEHVHKADWFVWPSVVTIMRESCIASKKTVVAALNSLETLEYIKPAPHPPRRKFRRDGGRPSTTYLISIDWLEESARKCEEYMNSLPKADRFWTNRRILYWMGDKQYRAISSKEVRRAARLRRMSRSYWRAQRSNGSPQEPMGLVPVVPRFGSCGEPGLVPVVPSNGSCGEPEVPTERPDLNPEEEGAATAPDSSVSSEDPGMRREEESRRRAAETPREADDDVWLAGVDDTKAAQYRAGGRGPRG
jgi:helix-turn-helix protein